MQKQYGVSLHLNERYYRAGLRPVVVVCIDGFDPAYMDAAARAGKIPFLEGLRNEGLVLTADCVLPSFTNPNNMSIVTGAPPSVHGISGNFFFDTEEGAEVVMNDPRFLRCGTILEAGSRAGLQVAAVTAKDKLRRLLAAGLDFAAGNSLCFSIEKASDTTAAEHGIADACALIGGTPPAIYSADASEAVLRAGVALLDRQRPDLLYLSTTDYVQHLHAPEEPEALGFMAALDSLLADLAERDVNLVVTADHGMSAKTDGEEKPDVIYLQSVLDETLPEAAARVILPITDPYVRHHGALGSFATVYLDESAIERAEGLLGALEGIESVLRREAAATQLELPPDRIGHISVLGGENTVFGTRADRHDLSALSRPLRSHGGRHEQRVPLIVNRPPTSARLPEPLRNFDAFWIGCNALEA